jgi:hypothetical protein
MNKPFAEMSFAELALELGAATQQRQAAEYVDGMAAYSDARDAAVERLAAVNAEIDKRLAACDVRQTESKDNGG